MNRIALVGVVGAAFALVMMTAGCPPDTLVGQPCDTPGDQCEGDKLIRCDGSYFIELAPCAYECRGDAVVTTHDGLITADETWTCLDGPHLVTGQVTVQPDVTLTIEQGTQIRMDPASTLNIDRLARLDALGVVEAPILVTSNTGEIAGFGLGAQGGINVFAVETGEPSVLQHTIIERGIHGLGVAGLADDTTPPVIEDCTFRDNQRFGIILQCNGDPEVNFSENGNLFFTNGDGDVSECNPDL
jgi:hypothetical protein